VTPIPKKLLLALALLPLILAPTIVKAQEPGAILVYTAQVVVVPEPLYKPVDPWLLRTSGGIVATATLEVRDGSVSVTSYTGDPKYRRIVEDTFNIVLGVSGSPGAPSDYYHVALGPGLEASRCGPATLVTPGRGIVVYTFSGVPLYASVPVARLESMGSLLVVTYSLEVDGAGVCSDPLVDGPDYMLVVGVSIASILGAVYAVIRLRPVLQA